MARAYGAGLLCLLLSLQAQVQAQELGRLFTSPEEREYLDYLRTEYLNDNQASDFNITESIPEIPVPPQAEVSGPAFYSLGGIFTQRDGSRMLWLNNRSLRESELPANMRLLDSAGVPTLRITLAEGSFDLRPGQSLDVANARVSDAFNSTGNNPQPSIPAASSEQTPAPEAAAPAQTALDSSTPAAAGTANTASAVSSASELREALRTGIDRASEQELAELMILLQEASNAQ